MISIKALDINEVRITFDLPYKHRLRMGCRSWEDRYSPTSVRVRIRERVVRIFLSPIGTKEVSATSVFFSSFGSAEAGFSLGLRLFAFPLRLAVLAVVRSVPSTARG